MQFDSHHGVERKVHEHFKFTRRHYSAVRSEHAFFGEVCDALDGIAKVRVVIGHVGLADFRHCVATHRPQTGKRMVDCPVVDNPRENPRVALARSYFINYDQKGGASAHT